MSSEPNQTLTEIETEDDQPEVDILQVYFGGDIHTKAGYTIHQPTIGEVKDFGESRFWSTASILCGNPTQYRVMLWEKGIDWNKITDFELFCMMHSLLSKEDTEIFFGELDLKKFVPVKMPDESTVLVNIENVNEQINETTYNELVAYLRTILDLHPKVEKAKGKVTKQWIIEEEKERLQFEKNKQRKVEWGASRLFTQISAACCKEGFKYTIQETLDLTIFQFMDAFRRLYTIQTSEALSHGMCSGFADPSKLAQNKDADWARDLYS